MTRHYSTSNGGEAQRDDLRSDLPHLLALGHDHLQVNAWVFVTDLEIFSGPAVVMFNIGSSEHKSVQA